MQSLLRRTAALFAKYKRRHLASGGPLRPELNEPYWQPGMPVPRFPKRKRPVKRAKSLLLELDRAERERLSAPGAAPHGPMLSALRAGDVVQLRLRTSMQPDAPTRELVGMCIACRHRGINSTFQIRNVYDGEAVEHGFFAYSPMIAEARVVDSREYRQSKLWYLRKRPIRESMVRVPPSALKSPPGG